MPDVVKHIVSRICLQYLRKVFGRGIWYFCSSSVLELTEKTVSLDQNVSMRYTVWLSNLYSTGSIIFAEGKNTHGVLKIMPSYFGGCFSSFDSYKTELTTCLPWQLSLDKPVALSVWVTLDRCDLTCPKWCRNILTLSHG